MSHLSRRRLFTAAAGLALARSLPASAQTPAPTFPFTLPPLGYAFDANEPNIDATTMQIHHDRHHAAYVTNLNAAVKDHPQVAALPLETILARLNDVPESIRTAVRNNGGGHANHSMFWTVMGGKGGAPSGALLAAIDRDLGGMDKMKSEVSRLGLGQFGSGWVFVSVTREGKLALTARPNQDTPLHEGLRVLFGNDVWEHAYYLKYQNNRGAYLTAWWNVVNWPAVEARYAAAMAGTLAI